MSHFRFRYKRVGHLRLRCRLARRQAVLLVLLVAFATRPAAAARRAAPAFAPTASVAAVLRVGDYVVCEEGDPKLVGHPDIRY